MFKKRKTLDLFLLKLLRATKNFEQFSAKVNEGDEMR